MHSSKDLCRINNNKTKQEKRRKRLKIDTAGPKQRVRRLIIHIHIHTSKLAPGLTSYHPKSTSEPSFTALLFKSSSSAKIRHEFKVNVVRGL